MGLPSKLHFKPISSSRTCFSIFLTLVQSDPQQPQPVNCPTANVTACMPPKLQFSEYSWYASHRVLTGPQVLQPPPQVGLGDHLPMQDKCIL